MFLWKAATAAVQLLVPVAEFEAIGPAVWCAETSGLIRQIEERGGATVKRVYIGDGRTFEWFWNEREEVVIEHNPGGSSCLVRLQSADR